MKIQNDLWAKGLEHRVNILPGIYLNFPPIDNAYTTLFTQIKIEYPGLNDQPPKNTLEFGEI